MRDERTGQTKGINAVLSLSVDKDVVIAKSHWTH